MIDPTTLADCWEQGVADAVGYLTGYYQHTRYENLELQTAYQFGYEDLLEGRYTNPFL